ncbi:MAG: Ig-like domain-containing protein [Gammaproteobacteria bacterium]|nr:Ig-like domain-containing protein [Gammaproteobacteria bacterium]
MPAPNYDNNKVKAMRSLLSLFLTSCYLTVVHAASGPGLGNLSYSEEELWTPISAVQSNYGHGKVFMVDGYLAVIWDTDGGGSPDIGGLDVWDVSDSYNPVKIKTYDNDETHRFREPHALSLWNRDGQIIMVAQSHQGIVLFDVTDITNEMPMLAELDLPGIEPADYGGAWWVALQAPYLYVSTIGEGLFVVDVSEPTAPVVLNHLPTGALGGIGPASVFAMGNLLIMAEDEDRGYTTMDIADPVNPVLIQTLDGASGYSHMFAAGKLLSSGGNGDTARMYVHDISHEGLISYAGEAGDDLGNGGYGSYQDGYFISGFSEQVAKFSIDPPLQVGSGSSGRRSRDEDFGQVLGNLIWAGDDHAVGTALIPHQLEPDTNGAEVEWIYPADGASGLPVSTRLGVTMSDEVAVESLLPANFILRGPDDEAVPGQLSVNMYNVSFSPDVPLAAFTEYEVQICGIEDLVGNVGGCFISVFFTGGESAGPGFTTSVPAPTCSIGPFNPVEAGTPALYRAQTENRPTSYRWNFGDGVVQETEGSATEVMHSSPGRRFVTLTVSNDGGTSRCGAVRIVHTPVTHSPPVSSSSIVTTGRDTFVVNPDNDTVTRFNSDYAKVWEVAVGDNPRTLALAPNGDVWVANEGDSTLSVLSRSGETRQTIALPYGSAPYGVVFAPDGGAAYISLNSSGRLLKLDGSGSILGELVIGPRPRGVAVSGDSSRILVTRFVSQYADLESVGEVHEVDGASFSLVNTVNLNFDVGPDTEASGRGVPNYLSQVRIAPDGNSAWVPSKKDNIARGRYRSGEDLTFESRTRTIVSQINLLEGAEAWDKRIDFNDRDLAQSLVFTPTGDVFITALQGSNVIEVWDALDLTRLGMMSVGRAPNGLAMSPDGTRLFVHNYMDRSVTVVDTSGLLNGTVNQPRLVTTVSSVANEALAPNVLNGKRIFFNAADTRMSRDGYISCASCHLDGGSDQMVWDFTQVGEGLRNTIDLIGRRGTNGGFVHWTANFDEIQDFEHDIRDGFGGSGFMADSDFNTGTRNQPLGDAKAGLSSELDDLATYVSSLVTFPDSPHRAADGSLTESGIAGQAVFAARGCASCHAGADFTDDLTHDVGTQLAASGLGRGVSLDGVGQNTPTLKGLWLSAPYLHHGGAQQLSDVLANPTHMGAELEEQEKAELTSYLLQIE